MSFACCGVVGQFPRVCMWAQQSVCICAYLGQKTLLSASAEFNQGNREGTNAGMGKTLFCGLPP